MDIEAKYIIAAIGGLCGAVVFLWKVVHSHHKVSQENLDRCNEWRDENTKLTMDLTGRVNRLEGEREGFIMGIEKLTDDVIREIRSLKDDSK